MPSQPELAIVVTAHREGRGIVPTLRSLARCLEEATANGLGAEVVVTLDRADRETVRAVETVLGTGALDATRAARTVRLDHGDLGRSRNSGIAETTARYVTVLDGDNLPSSTWLVDAHALLSQHPEPTVAHPERVLTFGAKREVWPLTGTDAPAFEADALLWFNAWDAFAMADRRVFEEHPYRYLPPHLGFGPEDWAWNCDTVAAGVPHLIVPGTTLFYAVRGHGSLAEGHGDSLLPPNELLRSRALAAEALSRLEPRRAPSTATSSAKARPRVVDHAIGTAAYALRPLRDRLRRPEPQPPQLPHPSLRDESLLQEWRAQHAIQPAIPYPTEDVVLGYGSWGDDWRWMFLNDRVAYWSLLVALPEKLDALYIAPWVGTGGADLLLRQYISSVRRQRPDAAIALVTTEPTPSTRLDEVDPSVTVVDLGAFRLDPGFAARVLGAIITQTRPSSVHVVNSTVGVDVIDRFGARLSETTRWFLSTFVIDRQPDGSEWSFLHHRSRDFFRIPTAILTDNEAFVRRMVLEHGAPRDAFLLQPQSVDETLLALGDRSSRSDGPLRLVWCGRFDRQKRLDRLIDVLDGAASSGLTVRAEVYGEAVIDDDPSLSRTLQELAARDVVVHPPFTHGFADIGPERFDALVITSDDEGTPNLMLEAMSVGLPVIAPAIGGIPAFIDDTTGWLVERPDDLEGFVNALGWIDASPEESARRADRGRMTVRQRCTPAALDDFLAGLPGYLPGQRSNGSGMRWFLEERTRLLLQDSDRLVLLYTGSNGHSNFGDILQNTNVIDYWRARSGVDSVLFMPAFAAHPAGRADRLRDWFGIEHIVFFAERGAEIDPEALPAEAVPPGTDGLVHVIGGGYLNAMWGEQHFAAVDAIATDFAASEILFSGLQIDDSALQGFERIAGRHPIKAIGVRDERSLEIARSGLDGERVEYTFDDLSEVLLDWGAVPERAHRTPADRPHVALHLNTSDYAGGDAALDHWREVLRQVAEQQPRRVTLVSAYADERAEVRDTLRSVAALAEDFPFPAFDVVDIATGALSARAGDGLPPALEELRRADYALCSSYHTAMLMAFLHVPVHLVNANPYFAQKAVLFRQTSIEEFLATPVLNVDFAPHLAARRAWLEQLDRMP